MSSAEMFGVERVPVLFVNAYLVDIDPLDPARGWFLVDTGLAGIGAKLIIRAAAARYGVGTGPQAIFLTHGHFDHAGSAHALAHFWGAPVYAHRLELPYLTGKSPYPPADPTVGGALAMMSRTFPSAPIDLRPHVTALDLPEAQDILAGWRVVPTPGHTPGHVSFYRAADGALLAGDALATMDQQSWVKTVTMPRELQCPPTPLTTDWPEAIMSVQRLAELWPSVIAAGHGLPIAGDAAGALDRFSKRITPPANGRYVDAPAVADVNGVVSIPPPPPDPVGLTLKVGAAAAITTAIIMATRRRAA